MSDEPRAVFVSHLGEHEFFARDGYISGSDSGESASMILAPFNGGPETDNDDAVQGGTDNMDSLRSVVLHSTYLDDPSARVGSSLGDFSASTAEKVPAEKALDAAEETPAEKAPNAKPAKGEKKKKRTKEVMERRAINNRLLAYRKFLKNWVSHPAENLYLHQVSFWDLRPSNMDEVEFTTQRHRMLIQRTFELPGFNIRAVEIGKCRDDDGTEMVFPVYIPYKHRRLWISLLATPHILDEKPASHRCLGNCIVAERVALLMEAAWVHYDLRYDNSAGRHFARRVSHHLKEQDDAFKAWTTTTDVQFAVKLFAEARRAYVEKRAEGEPVIFGGMETVEGLTQHMADQFLEVRAREALRDQTLGPVPAEVEEKYAFNSDAEEEYKTLDANSGYPNLVF